MMESAAMQAQPGDPRVARLEVEVSTLSRDISAVRTDMSALRTELKGDIERVGHEVAEKFDAVVEKFDANRRPNWQAAGVVVAVSGLVVTVLLSGLGYYAYTSSNEARGHADRRFEQVSAIVEGLVRVMDHDRQADAEFRALMREEWGRIRADYDATDAAITTLHERTRYEQGRSDADRFWEAEIRRLTQARLDRVEQRLRTEEQRP